jgi:hypothetical protein
MNQKAFDPSALHAELRGLDIDAQLAKLIAQPVTRDQAVDLELIAADLRANGNHIEQIVPGSDVKSCDVCGDLDASRIDYYWHPLAASQHLPGGGRDEGGDYIFSCPECASFNVEAIPTEYLIPGNSLCSDCGFEAEDIEFREYLVG